MGARSSSQKKIRGGPLQGEPARTFKLPPGNFLIYLDEAIIYKCVQRKL